MTVSRAVARTLAGGLTALSLTACLGVREPETAAPCGEPARHRRAGDHAPRTGGAERLEDRRRAGQRRAHLHPGGLG